MAHNIIKLFLSLHTGEHLGLNYCLEQILLFRDLVKLDMSYCGLGDDHEMLTQFQNLNRLV
jgi:hypothetical protein